MKIKLNVKKALLIILALSASNSQCGWGRGQLFNAVRSKTVASVLGCIVVGVMAYFALKNKPLKCSGAQLKYKTVECKNYIKSALKIPSQTFFINDSDANDMIIFNHNSEGEINKVYYLLKNPQIRGLVDNPILGIKNIKQIETVVFIKSENKVFVNGGMIAMFATKD